MENPASQHEKDEEIARLLNQLADVSAEQPALAACRNEVHTFDPPLSTASIALELLALETTAKGLKEMRDILADLRERLQALGHTPAVRLIDAGLAKHAKRLEAP